MTSTTPISEARASGNFAAVDHRAVLVPLDGSAVSEHALEPARWLAAHLGATVHTVIVGFVDDTRWYTGYVRSLRHRWPQVTPHFVPGLDVARGIADIADDIDGLVCMGTHGRARSAAVLGSTFVDAARTLTQPLVAIGPVAQVPPGQVRRVVACVDGTARSEQSLPLAAGWARRLDATLDVVAVVDPLAPLPTHAERHREGPLLDPTAYVTGLRRLPGLADMDVEAHVVFDPLGPDEGLVDHLAAHPAALVVVASRLRTRVDRALHGSATARIVHACPVPVLVQPTVPPAARTDWSK
jgi:nucleotide-binding universal stress UspA family protein